VQKGSLDLVVEEAKVDDDIELTIDSSSFIGETLPSEKPAIVPQGAAQTEIQVVHVEEVKVNYDSDGKG